LSKGSEVKGRVELKRVLGRRDLILLFVVAVFNLNVVPSIAASGGVAIWLWLASLILFFWPQGIAVIELAHRYPGEGGVYLWSKELFGDFHGFFSGWCYWTNNMLYVPTVMLYFVGVSVFVLGPKYESLTDNKVFAICTSLVLLALLAVLNIVGSAVGKWLNNVGAIGTCIAAAVLVVLAAFVMLKPGSETLRAVDFRIPHDPRLVMNSFGVICFALVGLELASVMGDEIESPRKTLPSAVAWGGIISGFLYVATTLTLLAAVGSRINVLQGVMQAIGHLSAQIGIGWIIPVFAFMLSVSIAGIGSAWLGGSARIPFVAGLDSYMPSWLGRLHPKYGTPYAALLVHALISMALCVIFFGFSSVEEAFETMLSLAVVLQLIPYVYIFGALLKLAVGRPDGRGVYSRGILIAAGVSGLITTLLGIVLQYFPPGLIKSLGVYEAEMMLGTAVFVGLAAYFFFVYGRRKSAEAASIQV